MIDDGVLKDVEYFIRSFGKSKGWTKTFSFALTLPQLLERIDQLFNGNLIGVVQHFDGKNYNTCELIKERNHFFNMIF